MVVLNQTSLDWEKIEDKMKDGDILIYPGYLMSHLTDGKIKPLLYAFDTNTEDNIYTSAFQLIPDPSFKIKNLTGEYLVKDVIEEITENRNRFYFEINLGQLKDQILAKLLSTPKKKDDI